MSTSLPILGQQIWVGGPDRRYHNHAVLGDDGQLDHVFLTHRHAGGEAAHGHQVMELGPEGVRAADVEDVIPTDEIRVPDDMRYPPEDDMIGVRRRQADLEALL